MNSNTDELILTPDLLKKITREDRRMLSFSNGGLDYGDLKKLKDHHVMDVLTNHVNADQVSYISLTNCGSITNDTLIQISNMCPQLEILWVTGCDMITDDGIVAIAERCGQQLKQLYYRNCNKCTDAALESVVNNCHQLKKLGAGNCGISTIPENIGNQLTNLKYLNLSNNKITKIPPSLAILLEQDKFAFYITNNPYPTNNSVKTTSASNLTVDFMKRHNRASTKKGRGRYDPILSLGTSYGEEGASRKKITKINDPAVIIDFRSYCCEGVSRKKITRMSLISLLVSGGIIATVLYFTVLRPKTCDELIPEGINNPLIANGFCNGGLFMTDACQNDGGDCGDDSCRRPPDNPYSTTSIAIADVNGDGWQDIVVVNSIHEPHQLLIGKGNGAFHDPVHLLRARSSSGILAVADVNGDGFPDIVDCDSTYIYLRTNKGNGAFQDRVRLSDDYMMGVNAVAIADVNVDGWPDLVVGINPRSDKLLLNNGDGTFQDPVDLPSTSGTTVNIVLADVNGDEAPDILIIGNENNKLLFNNGDGTFQDPVRLPGDDIVKFGSGDIAVGDLNGDDKPDILMGGRSNLVLWRNAGDGTFEDPVELANLGAYYSIVLVDMNDDGILDIVVGFPAEVLIGNGDGTFKDPVGLPCSVAMDTSSIAVADVDNDGKPDIVIGNSGRQSNQLLINLGDGISFKLPPGATSPWLPQ